MGKSNDQRLIYFLFKELIPFTKKNTKIALHMKQNRFWLLELATMSIMGKTFNLSRVMEDFGFSIYSLY